MQYNAPLGRTTATAVLPLYAGPQLFVRVVSGARLRDIWGYV
jgi:hypothetical protein